MSGLWLVETGLATPTEGTLDQPTQKPASLTSFFNPFWMKVPLLQPERLLDLLLPVCFAGCSVRRLCSRWFCSGSLRVL